MKTIAGAGLAGLTAAINLAINGENVTVLEKNGDVGEQIKENAQMLPNWLSKNDDIIGDLEKCNVKINPVGAIYAIKIFINGNKAAISSRRPMGFTVLRGGRRSLEYYIKRQAERNGVKFEFKRVGPRNADIIATGKAKPNAVIYGQVFEGDFDHNTAKVFIDQANAPNGYGYLYPHDRKRASLVIARTTYHNTNLKQGLENMIAKQEENLGELNGAERLYDFGGSSNFFLTKSAIKHGSLHVGESAGFQDPLFGFGMRYAISSGYLAALSLIKHVDYDVLWRREFLKEFNALLSVRKSLYSDIPTFGRLLSGHDIDVKDVGLLRSSLFSHGALKIALSKRLIKFAFARPKTKSHTKTR